MEDSMAKLYTPDTPALAFIILLNSNGSSNGDGIPAAINFRQNCLDPVNVAVLVIQVDEDTPVDPNLASKPEFFFKYDGTTNIGVDVTNALMQVATYNMNGYSCNRDKSTW